MAPVLVSLGRQIPRKHPVLLQDIATLYLITSRRLRNKCTTTEEPSPTPL
jgi:hypothetical protein